MNRSRTIVAILSLIAAIAAIVILFLNDSEYYTLFFLPLTYAITLLFVGLGQSQKNSLTFWLLTIVSFLRYVACPLLETIGGNLFESSRLYSESAVAWTPILMVYELVVVWVFFVFFSRIKELKSESRSPIEPESLDNGFQLVGNRNAYFAFSLMALAAFLLFGMKSGTKINFIFISAGTKLRVGDNESTFASIISMALTAGIAFAFLACLDACKPSARNPSGKYLIAILAGLLMIMIIIGERRTPVFYNSFVVAIILGRVFPEKRRTTIKFIGFAGLGVLLLMTIYKVLNAFLYDSYAEAVSNTSFGVKEMAGQLDAYFAGPRSVMVNLAFAETFDGNAFRSLLYDIARSTFGISFLVKGERMVLSEMFNYYLYNGEQTTGFLLTSVGYGTIIFGKLLGAFFTVFRLLAVMTFEKLLKKAKSYEYTYLFAYCFVSTGFLFYSSIIAQINSLSRMIVIYSIIIMCAVVLNGRTRNDKMTGQRPLLVQKSVTKGGK